MIAIFIIIIITITITIFIFIIINSMYQATTSVMHNNGWSEHEAIRRIGLVYVAKDSLNTIIWRFW